MSVPSAKMAISTDSPGAEDERRVSRPGVPLTACSSGMVTSDSTSDADRPGASVWITTWGGANSGKTSIGAPAAARMPKKRSDAARANTISRLEREKPTRRVNTSISLGVRAVTLRDARPERLSQEDLRSARHDLLPFRQALQDLVPPRLLRADPHADLFEGGAIPP